MNTSQRCGTLIFGIGLSLALSFPLPSLAQDVAPAPALTDIKWAAPKAVVVEQPVQAIVQERVLMKAIIMPVCGDHNRQDPEMCDDGMHCSDTAHTPCASADACAGKGDGTCAPRSGDGCSSTCETEYKLRSEVIVLQEAQTQPADTQPVDECAQECLNTSSVDCKCCRASSKYAVARQLNESTSPDNSSLTPEEVQACQCLRDPLSFGCPCLGKHQLDDVNACASAATSDLAEKTVFRIDDVKREVTATRGTSVQSATKLCACASPQPFDTHMQCNTEGSRVISRLARSNTILMYACLYDEQVKALMEQGKGATVVTLEGSDYIITTETTESICKAFGGTVPETQPAESLPTVEEEGFRRIEGQEALAKYAETPPQLVESGDAVNKLEIMERIYPVHTVPCIFKRPQCPCTGPETTPTTQPVEEPPPPPPPPPPPLPPVAKAEPKLRVCVCRWGEYEALCPDNGESIPLQTSCPSLTVKAFTSAEAFKLYNVASDYYRKPEDASARKKLMDVLNERLHDTAESDSDPTISYSTLGPLTKAGAPLVPADGKQIRGYFQKDALVLGEDGTLTMKDSSALQIFSGEAALTASSPEGGPKIVAMNDLFKEESPSAPVVTGDNQFATVVFGTDGAAVRGSGVAGGCGAKSSLLPDDAPWTAVGPWTLAMAALTLITWRFRPLRRRALTGSFTNTRAKGSSTKN